MAKEIVVTSILSEEMLQAGENVLRHLDDNNFKIGSALWFYSAESQQWRLILSSPVVLSDGPRKAYKQVQTLLEKLQKTKIALQDIMLLDQDDPLLLPFRGLLNVTKINNTRYTRSTFNGVYIEDVHFYRLSATPAIKTEKLTKKLNQRPKPSQTVAPVLPVIAA